MLLYGLVPGNPATTGMETIWALEDLVFGSRNGPSMLTWVSCSNNDRIWTGVDILETGLWRSLARPGGGHSRAYRDLDLND
jgi:hypothetical protein